MGSQKESREAFHTVAGLRKGVFLRLRWALPLKDGLPTHTRPSRTGCGHGSELPVFPSSPYFTGAEFWERKANKPLACPCFTSKLNANPTRKAKEMHFQKPTLSGLSSYPGCYWLWWGSWNSSCSGQSQLLPTGCQHPSPTL